MKKLFALLLVVFLFGGSTMAFAWWDQLETTDENITIGVGEGVTISVNLDEQTQGSLVPNGVVMKTNDITEVEVKYTVNLDSNDINEALNFDVSVINLEIGGLDTYKSLVDIVVVSDSTIQNESVDVTLTVTLNMPSNQTEYDAIVNQNITFDVQFNATQQD